MAGAWASACADVPTPCTRMGLSVGIASSPQTAHLGLSGVRLPGPFSRPQRGWVAALQPAQHSAGTAGEFCCPLRLGLFIRDLPEDQHRGLPFSIREPERGWGWGQGVGMRPCKGEQPQHLPSVHIRRSDYL